MVSVQSDLKTGRRKCAVARVRLRDGSGSIIINGKKLEEYFPSKSVQVRVTFPLTVANSEQKYDIIANVRGGGSVGQADALRLGIARLLIARDPDIRTLLKREGLLTRDARVKESKKYGLKKARKAPQYSKR